jgi:hypothetical protein
MEKLYHRLFDDLFQTLTGFGLRKHSCEYRNLRRASESCALREIAGEE